jgi:hypothetical protein
MTTPGAPHTPSAVQEPTLHGEPAGAFPDETHAFVLSAQLVVPSRQSSLGVHDMPSTHGTHTCDSQTCPLLQSSLVQHASSAMHAFMQTR